MIAVAMAACWMGIATGLSVMVVRRVPALASVAVALALCLLAAVLSVTFLDVPFGSGTDELIYQGQAEAVARSLSLTGDVTSRYAVLDEGKFGWPAVLGTMYWVAGTTSPYLGVVVNATITYMALLLAAAAGQRLYPATRPGVLHVSLVVGAPALLMFGASLMRESWAWMSVAIGVHALISNSRGRHGLGVALLVLACALAFWIRTPLAVIIAVAWSGALVISAVYRRFGFAIAMAALCVSFVVGLRVLVPVLAAAGYSPQLLLVARDYLAAISTTGFVSRDPFTVAGMAEALVRVGLGPFPWEYRPAAVWGWVLVNHLHWLVVACLAIAATRRYGMDAARIAVLAFGVILLAGIAVGLTNYGIVVRMRASLVVAILPLAWGATILSPDRDRAAARQDEAVRS